MEGNCQVIDVFCKCYVTRPLPKKVYLGLAERENGRIAFIIYYHLNKRYIPTRQQFQVTRGT